MAAARLASLFRKLRSPAARRPRPARRPRLALERLEDRLTPSTLIPVPNHRDLVFDATHNQLDITTSDGKVQRWDMASQSLLPAYNVGTSLYGADIHVTTGGPFLYATEGQTGNGQGTVHKVNLTTGAVTDLTYALAPTEAGSYSLAVGNNGLALFDGSFTGSGTVPLRQIDLNTDNISTRSDDPGAGGSGQVNQNTVVRRGADGGLFFFTQSGNASGPVFTYTAASNSFPGPAVNTNLMLDNQLTAVNRNGSLIAVEMPRGLLPVGSVSVLDANLHRVKELPAVDGGVAFDPNQDLLYGVSTPGDAVVAFDTHTWAVKFIVPIDEGVGPGTQYGNGVMAVSPDSHFLFLATSQGVREVPLPQATGVASQLAVSGFPAYILAGLPGAFRVTALDPAGNVATGYLGTVHFSSNDPQAALPPDYTFTPADHGTHVFAATLNTFGVWSINVTDRNTGFTVSQGNIIAHPSGNDLAAIPVPDHKDLVFDPTRNVLYITTGHGTVERYDVATQTLLAPFQVGVSLLGADLTPDGRFLYVADAQRGATQGSFHKIDLSTGVVTDLNYNQTSASWDVAIGANGKALADLRSESAGTVPLYQINLATDALTARSDDPGAGPSGQVAPDTLITRGAGGGLFFFTQSGLASGPIFDYSAPLDTFSQTAVNTNLLLDNRLSAVNRNGTLVAVEGATGAASVLNPVGLGRVKELGGIDGGVAFDPTKDVLYGVNAGAGQVVAFDTNTWAVKYVLFIGESVGTTSAFGSGVMAVSADGRNLFLVSPTGVRQIALPQATGVASQLAVGGFPAYILAGLPGAFRVTALDPAGNVATGYLGTVHFSSNDPQAALPPDYTFTPADHGTHVFAATLNSLGGQGITATDTAQGFSDSQLVAVHADGDSLIPLPGHQDLAYDPAHNILYVTSSDGTVQRYDVTAQTLLAPFQAGVSLRGADLTPGGQVLYAADAQRGATQGSFHAVNLGTGAVADLNYNLTSASWDVAVGANGKGFTTERLEVPGSVPLYQLDTRVNSLTPVTNDPGSGGQGQVGPDTLVRRSADHSLFLFAEGTVASGPLFAYDATAGTWSQVVTTGVALDGVPAAVNRNGTLVAVEINGGISIFDRSLNPVRTLPGVTGNLLFDPFRDFLYVASGSTVTGYNTSTWGAQFSLPIGETLNIPLAFQDGVMAVSTTGQLFVTAPSGVRVLDLPFNQVIVSGFPNPATAGAPGSVTVKVENARGQLLANYRGTVHFSSTDPRAVLPADYTFTAADAGMHTFTNLVTLKTAGTQSITATDVSDSTLIGTESGITVSPGNASFTLSGIPSALTAGTAANATLTVKDGFGNLITGYAGTVHFTSPDPQAGLPADYTFTAADAGAHTFSVTLKTAGTQGVTATDTASSSLTASQSGITVSPAAVSQLAVTAQPPGAVLAGAAFGLTVAAEDAYGNVVPTFTGTVNVALKDNPGGATLGGTTSASLSNGVATFSGLTLNQVAAGYTLRATVGSLTAVTNTVNVEGVTLTGASAPEFRPVGTPAGTLATQPGTGRTFTYTLVGGAGSTDNASFSISGNQLVTADAFDSAAKSSYSVRVRSTDDQGRSVELPFTITVSPDPMHLMRTGRTLTVSGTSGSDTFTFAADPVRHAMTLNGLALAVDAASVDTVLFNGNGGSDSVTLAATGTGNTASLAPTGGSLRGSGYLVAVNNGPSQISVFGGPSDAAYFTDSAGADTFLATPTYAYLTDGGFTNTVSGFGSVHATSSGGSDRAYLYDTAGGASFLGTSTYAYLSGPAYTNVVSGFPTVIATGTAGDSAYLYGAPSGGNVLIGTATYSYLYGSGFFNEAVNFPRVVGNASAANDLAYLYGAAAGGNVLVATPTYAYLTGPGYFDDAVGFQKVTATAGASNDNAYLYGAAGNVFVATSTNAYLYGPGYFNDASGFHSVYGYSGDAGLAYLLGTGTSADTYVNAGSYAYLYGDLFFELASGFTFVYANPNARR
jgi:hypothetical protein